MLRLAYRAAGRRDETVRAVEPLGVVFNGGAWYLGAWCRLRRVGARFPLNPGLAQAAIDQQREIKPLLT